MASNLETHSRRCFERLDENFESRRVLRQLEQSQDAHNVQKFDGITTLRPHRSQCPISVEGHCGDQVDDVDWTAEEGAPAGTEREADRELQREPQVAQQLHVEELGMCPVHVGGAGRML